MENKTELLKSLFEKAEEYGKTTYDLLKLKTIDKLSDIASTLILKLAIAVVIFFFVLVVSVGAALWIGELLGKSYYGFFVIAGFYALVAIILQFFMSKWVKNMLVNVFIHMFK